MTLIRERLDYMDDNCAEFAELGAAMIEYLLGVVLICLVITAAVGYFQGSTEGRIQTGKTIYSNYDLPAP